MNDKYYLIRSIRGDYWQTSKGFVSSRPDDGTKYNSREHATMVIGGCVPGNAQPTIVECTRA